MTLGAIDFAQNNSDAPLMQNSKSVHRFQPLDDPRWSRFLQRHPRSSVFHTVEWLEALRRTYRYQPIAITTCPAGAELQNAAVFCRVESWLTGRRLVSLPFSDHCDFLTDNATDLAAIVSALEDELRQENLRYFEIRPIRPLQTVTFGSHSTHTYCLHQIDLKPNLDTLFSNCHKDSTQRKIRRAEREDLAYEEGRSEFLLDSFYHLLILTRRRHMVLPQPKRWFQSLIDCFGKALKIRVAFKDEEPIASILTLRYKDTLVYKYGGSDARFHHLGGMHLLFWRSIEEAKRDGLCVFDLGRSECENTGLNTFKDRWGAARSLLTYSRVTGSPKPQRVFMPVGTGWKQRMVRRVLPYLSDYILSSAGKLIYRHIG